VPTRLREYATMLAGAGGGGMAGALFDQLTLTVSPAYFMLGKGVGEGSLRWGAAATGFHGGLPLGALASGILLWLHGRGHRVVLRGFIVSCALSILPASVLAIVVMVGFDPFGVRAASVGVLTPAEADRFLVCWGLHVGAYLGPVSTVARAVGASTRCPPLRRPRWLQ
jgi:hypothetical protein